MEDKKCAMCGRPAGDIVRDIGDTTYVFDNEECVRTFRKFYSVYGKYFSMLLKEG